MTPGQTSGHGVLRSETIRASNARLVLDSLGSLGSATRAELSERTSLSRQALGPILRSLVDDGLVDRFPNPVSTRGRPAAAYAVAPSGSLSALLIQRPGELDIFVSNALGEVIASAAIPSTRGSRAEAVAGGAILELDALLARHELDRSRLEKLTFSVEGVVDDQRHLVHDSPAWDDQEIVVDDLVIDLLPAEIDLTVSSRSRFMARAVIAEAQIDPTELVMVLHVSSDVWLYAAQHGVVLASGSGCTGYISHERISGNARICRCGQVGCFATLVDDSAVDLTLDETFQLLATGISPMVRVIDPDHLLFNGPWAADDPQHREALETGVHEQLGLTRRQTIRLIEQPLMYQALGSSG